MPRATPQLTGLDLYAGAGGATQGLKDAGIRVVAGVENDPSAAASYELNHSEVELIKSDIRDVDASQLLEALELEPGDLGILQACPPCPSWSSLGAKNRDDPRKELVADVARFLKAFLPHAFILENVPGLAADERLGTLLKSARKLGYAVRVYTVDAVAFGVPQRRRRLIALGVRYLPEEALPEDLSAAIPMDFHRTPRTVNDALTTVVLDRATDELHRGRSHRPKALERIKAIPLGGTRFDLPEHLRLACHEGLGRRATASYGRMPLDGPAPTLTTRCTTPACGSFIHPTEDRGITLREAALLQTFPRTYRFSGRYDEIERQIGNAIPVRLAHGVAHVAAALVATASGGVDERPAGRRRQ